MGSLSFSRDLPNPGIKPRSPALQVDSLPAEPQGKPKNTGVGSLSLWDLFLPGKDPDPGIEMGSPALQADSLPAGLSRSLPELSSCDLVSTGNPWYGF